MTKRRDDFKKIIYWFPSESADILVKLSFKEKLIWIPTFFFICTIFFFFITLTAINIYLLTVLFFSITTILYSFFYYKCIRYQRKILGLKKITTLSLILFLLCIATYFLWYPPQYLLDLYHSLPKYNFSNKYFNEVNFDNLTSQSIAIFSGGASIFALIQIAWLRRTLEFDQYTFPEFLNEITSVLDSVDVKQAEQTSFYYLCLVHAPGICPRHYNESSAAVPQFQQFMRSFERVMSSQCKKEIAMLTPHNGNDLKLDIPTNTGGLTRHSPFMEYWIDWISESWKLDKGVQGSFYKGENYNTEITDDIYADLWDKVVSGNTIIKKDKNPSIPLEDIIKLIDVSFKKLFIEHKEQSNENDWNIKFRPVNFDKSITNEAFINIFLSDHKGFIAFISPKIDNTFQIEGMKITNKKMLDFLPDLFDSVCTKHEDKKENIVYLKHKEDCSQNENNRTLISRLFSFCEQSP